MVPMETFCPASKELSLVVTLESLPSFQPLCLSLSSGLPFLLLGTTVEPPFNPALASPQPPAAILLVAPTQCSHLCLCSLLPGGLRCLSR